MEEGGGVEPLPDKDTSGFKPDCNPRRGTFHEGVICRPSAALPGFIEATSFLGSVLAARAAGRSRTYSSFRSRGYNPLLFHMSVVGKAGMHLHYDHLSVTLARYASLPAAAPVGIEPTTS